MPGERQGSGSVTKKILLIDDEPYVRRTTRRMLEYLRCEVIEAASGTEAVDLFRKNLRSIGLVLLDQRMPEKSGDEVMAELRAIQSNIPVVMMSGFQDPDQLRQQSDTQPLEFLQKPFRIKDLENIVFRHFERNQGAQ